MLGVIFLNILDVGIILILIMSFIVGFKKGFIKEVVSLVGILAVFIISFILMEPLGDFLCKIFPFFKFVGAIGDMVVFNIILYRIIAFMIIFSILLSFYAILIKISGIIQKLVHMTIILWLPSKILGGVVGIIAGYIITFVVMMLLMIPLGSNPIFSESKIIDFMLNKTPVLSEKTNGLYVSVNEVYTLGDKVSKGEISKNEANLRTVEIMLNYKIISKDKVVELVEDGKINSISGIEKVINKY